MTVKPKPKPTPKFVKMACYQATAYFIYNIMGFACISVPIRNKQIQMYANTQTLDLIAFVSWLSFVLLLYTFWQILSQNYCGITDSVYSVTLLTELFVSIRSSNTQKQRWRLYCTETAGFQPSFPPLPRLFSSSLYLGWILFFFFNTLLKEIKVQAVERGQFPRFTVSLVQQIITTMHTH